MSFNYRLDEKDVFFQKVFFGNYVEKLCWKKDDTASSLIKEKNNRTIYNNSVFRFVNENNIKTIVCFSKLVFNNLPSMNYEMEEIWEDDKTVMIGSKKSVYSHCLYKAGASHNYCDVILDEDLLVLSLRHPSAGCGYSVEKAKEYLSGIEALSEVYNC